SLAAGACPIYGPVFPIPTDLMSSGTIKEALKAINQTISSSFKSENSAYGPVNSTAAYTLHIFSLDSKEPLLEYYHDGTTLSNNSGVQELDGDTIFRIGSISKLITVYLFLTELGDGLWNDPITQHIPELRGRDKSEENPVDYINWDQITVGAMAGHLAGLPRDLVDIVGLYANTDTSFGFPLLLPSEYPACIVTSEKYTCTRQQFFDAINDRQPTFLPNTVAAYSDTGILLLAYALESITGRSYEEILKTNLVDVLGLTGTSFSKPEDVRGAIPFNIALSQWARDLGATAPMGGLYASTSDLSKIGRSILNSTLLQKNTTRAWLKPTSYTSSLYGDVGRPWEIYRAADVGPSKRLVDLYTKGGDLGLYQANLAVVPDYNMGFALAVAGTGSHLWLDNLIVDMLFPALEAAAREQTDASYAGTYTVRNGGNSSIVLNTDPQLPGLGISSWISNGTDMLTAFGTLLDSLGLPANIPVPLTPSALRVYPTNLERETDGGTEVAWRMSLDPQVGTPFTGPFSACSSWFSVDLLVLGKFPIDEFLFTL
ncbi:beta-lactamase/transpeptidase-like protein, partial [Amniculicola lignicola CBS 123094]